MREIKFTGLKDKNVQEIYEDVVIYKDVYHKEKHGMVEFSEGAWLISCLNGDDKGNNNITLFETSDPVEVIGKEHEKKT